MERYKRQSDIIVPRMMTEPIHIIGAGGIGSWAALTIAKMGAQSLIIYDNDVVEDHNIASQFFKESQKGMNKVDALKVNIAEQTGIDIDVTTNLLEEEHIAPPVESRRPGIVIIAVDSMEERHRLYDILDNRDLRIIDGRMGGLQLEVYSVHLSRYPDTLVDPEKVERDSCTAQSINFNCLGIASFIANAVRQIITDDLTEYSIIYDFVSNSFLKKVYASYDGPDQEVSESF